MKEKFIISTIVINSDLSITHFITNGGFFVIIDKISISFLPRLIIDLDITEILFYDDVLTASLVIFLSRLIGKPFVVYKPTDHNGVTTFNTANSCVE